MCLTVHQITLLVAVYTVVQGLAVLSLNIVLILVGTGPLSDTTHTFIRRASYYLSCPKANDADPTHNITCSLYAPLNPDAVLAYEISYAVLHGLWLAGAVVIFTQLCKKKVWQDYILWMLVCSVLIILDTVTGIFYSIDISKEKDEAQKAAVMMTLISFRGVAFYVLNIVCLALVSYALRDTLAQRPCSISQTESNESTKERAETIELQSTQDPPSLSDETSLSPAIPAAATAATKSELDSNPAKESDSEILPGPKPVYLGYQDNPELMERNKEIVSQIQQGPGPDMYRSPSFSQPYPARRLGPDPGYREEGREYRGYPYSGPGNEGAMPRGGPTYPVPHRAPNAVPAHHPPYTYSNPVPVEEGSSEEDYYPGEMEGMSRVPPRAAARGHRSSSSRHGRPQPPGGLQTPSDPEKKVPPPVPPKPAPYDVRPFSYVNPSFRPVDHGDVMAMKSHVADIKKTLVEDLEQLKMKEEEKNNFASDAPQPKGRNFEGDSKPHHSDGSDSPGPDYDAPWSSSARERRPEQYEDGPGKYGEELMTAV